MSNEPLKQQFQKTVGIVDYNLTDDELREILKKVSSIPVEQRTISRIQEIVSSTTGVKRFIVLEVRDTSDIDYLLDQIEDELKGK